MPPQSAATAAPQYSSEFLAEDQSGKLVGTAVTFLVLDTIAVLLRYVSRRMQRTPWIWADVYVPVAWFVDISTIISALVTVRYGAGRHLAAVPPENLIPFFKTNYFAQPIMYFIGVNIPKLAVLDIYLHIFVDKFSRIVIYITQFILIAQAVVNVPVVAVQCLPNAYLWDPTIPGGHCHNISAHFFWSALPNIVTDLIMLILPIPLVKRLHTSTSTKVGLGLTFLLGNLGLAFSIVRFVGFHYQYADTTWSTIQGSLWTIVEPGVYLLCACAITYRPLFSWLAHDSVFSGVITRVRLRSKSSAQSATAATLPSRDNVFLHPKKTKRQGSDQEELDVLATTVSVGSRSIPSSGA